MSYDDIHDAIHDADCWTNDDKFELIRFITY